MQVKQNIQTWNRILKVEISSRPKTNVYFMFHFVYLLNCWICFKRWMSRRCQSKTVCLRVIYPPCINKILIGPSLNLPEKFGSVDMLSIYWSIFLICPSSRHKIAPHILYWKVHSAVNSFEGIKNTLKYCEGIENVNS